MGNDDIAGKWLKAFNEHNLEDLMGLYDDYAVHYSPNLKVRKPETNGLIKGKEAMRNWWQDAFERLPQLTYQEKSITANAIEAGYVERAEDYIYSSAIDYSEGKGMVAITVL